MVSCTVKNEIMLLMMGVSTRNMSSKEYINKITYFHQVGISHYFMKKMHVQATLKYHKFLCTQLLPHGTSGN